MNIENWFNNSKTVSDIITGLYSSGIFLIVLAFLKPRIRICDKIAFKYNESINSHEYYFKIINRSLFFKVYDIQVRTWSTEMIPSKNGDDYYFKKIDLVKDYQWVLSRLFAFHIFQDLIFNDKRLKKRTDYAAQFVTREDLITMIKNKRFITIEVIAKHSLTGFTRVLSKSYKHVGDIEKGDFFSGNSCKIK